MVCRIAYGGSVESAREDLGPYHMTRRFAKRAYASKRYHAYKRGVGENSCVRRLSLDLIRGDNVVISDAVNLWQKVCH
jgi:hypothetical protein